MGAKKISYLDSLYAESGSPLFDDIKLGAKAKTISLVDKHNLDTHWEDDLLVLDSAPAGFCENKK